MLSDDFIENDSDIDDDDEDDASSTSSGMSACSLMSTMSGQGWKPMAKHLVWVSFFLNFLFYSTKTFFWFLLGSKINSIRC